MVLEELRAKYPDFIKKCEDVGVKYVVHVILIVFCSEMRVDTNFVHFVSCFALLSCKIK